MSQTAANDGSMTGPHWDFALKIYGAPGVADACIALQDRYDVDVNVLLLALYANAERGIAIDGGKIADFDAAGRDIRETAVVPLRAIRRAMKGRDFGAATEAVRNRVKAAELGAEQLEQAALGACVADWPAGDAMTDPEAVTSQTIAHFAGPGGAPSDTAIAHLAVPIANAVRALRP